MERLLTQRRWTLVLPLALAMVGATSAVTPALGQQEAGGRFRVLLPALEPKAGAKDDFGKDAANELRKLIDELPTHAAVEKKDFQDALRKYRLKEQELDCVKSRQLAVQIGAELVMCGEYQPAGSGMQVSARFIGAKTGDTFEVDPFPASTTRQAAQHVFTKFQSYTTQIRLTAFCIEYLGSQQWANALQNCNQALEHNPRSVMASYGRARALMELDSLEASLEMHKRVLELNPVLQEAMLTAGIVATKMNNQELALSYFNQYLELNPGHVDVRLKVASDMAKEGDPGGALRIVEEGLKTDSADVALLTFAGHFALGAANKAEQTPKGANGGAQAPTPVGTRLYETALKHYEKVFAAQAGETDAGILLNMLLTLGQLGRFTQAAALGERIVQAKPQDPKIWAAYAEILQKTGKLDAALAALDSALARDPNLEKVHLRRAFWLLQADRLEGARQNFQKAIERGEITREDVASNIFGHGYREKYQKAQSDAALELFDMSRDFATSAEQRAMANFFSGLILYNRGIKVQEPATPESARQALPIFQRSLEFFEASGAYREQAESLKKLISGAKQYIERQQAIIKQR